MQIENDIPDFLRIPQDQRNAAWKGRKLTKVKMDIDRNRRDEDASTKAFRRQIEKQQRDKKQAALKRLRENYGKKKR